MRNVIIGIELRGDPGRYVYDRLHGYMLGNQWAALIQGDNGSVNLPHSMYAGTTEIAFSTLASNLRVEIEKRVWKSVVVLVIAWTNWAQAGSEPRV